MTIPYGLPQRCSLALVVLWFLSSVLSVVSGGSTLQMFIYLAVVALPAIAIYSFMNVSTFSWRKRKSSLNLTNTKFKIIVKLGGPCHQSCFGDRMRYWIRKCIGFASSRIGYKI